MRMITLKLLALSSLLTCSWGFESFMLRSLQQCENMEPDTHSYCDCLGSCEYTIQVSELGGYCVFPDFTSALNYCLNCALTYKIWQEYGDQVAAAASACGDKATPSLSLAPLPNVSIGSTTASIAVIATTSTTVSSTSTQSHAATTRTSSVVSSTTSTRSVIPSTSAAPSQVTGAGGSSKENSNWYLLIGLIMIGLL